MISLAALAVGAAVLAFEPVVWLVRTWFAPAYDSPGGLIFAVAAALFAWSVSSPRVENATSTRHAWWLLAATAAVRLAGRVLAIHVLGALALTVDVYALGVLCGLDRRERAVSPLWLAVLFGFSLPVERIFQRLIGYALQHVSAAGACSLLHVGFHDVACAGVGITLAGKEVLVDLPCSGARGLVLLSVLFAGLAALTRPTTRQAMVGLGLAVVSALVANSVRIAALAVGLAFPDTVGVDVMAQPWHDLVGLAALAFGVLPLVWWARLVQQDVRLANSPRRGEAPSVVREAEGGRFWLAALVLAAALGVVVAPREPVDVARPIDTIDLPQRLDGHPAARQPLSDMERDYFTQFGGAAAKASYGAHTLLVVRTSAPLRHLHAPNECLAGAGFDVDTVGVTGRNLPGATYLATAPDGSRWRVVVTYVSERGERATNVSEVIWRWMQHPGTTWTAIERMHPAAAPLADDEAFDATVARAFDLPRVGITTEATEGATFFLTPLCTL